MLPPAPALRRAFATTARRLVGPESPSFIEIPVVSLPKTHPAARAKGILPVPKNLFPSTHPEKGTPEYLAAATPEPTAPRFVAGEAEAAAYQDWQARMAEKRRTNLREGLSELKVRKEKRENARKALLTTRNSERDAALTKAEADDVRLTLPSVLSTLRIDGNGILPDPRRAERLEEKRVRLDEIRKKKYAERQRAVHDLYLSASKFILTEAQLDEVIDQQFKERDASQAMFMSTMPPSVRELLTRKENPAGNLSSDDVTNMLEISGELTGGKMKGTAGRSSII